MPGNESMGEGITQADGITAIGIEGFKSFRDKTTLEIRPLTLLAGANSAGKSSAMQPLLLLKQTLDATYDPGPLLLDGPNVRFSEFEQMLWAPGGYPKEDGFSTTFRSPDGFEVSLRFAKTGKDLVIDSLKFTAGTGLQVMRPGMKQEEILNLLPQEVRAWGKVTVKWSVSRMRCYLFLRPLFPDRAPIPPDAPLAQMSPMRVFDRHIRGVIHLPALRGNPLREYPTSGVGATFTGQFQNYVAGILSGWKDRRDRRLKEIGAALRRLGVSWKVDVKRLDDTKVELRVGRLPRSRQGGARDLVNVADVGFGVSQVLPVVVALLAARPGQLVYIEQPEIHLHPRAQAEMAHLLADAAKRDIRLVVETHSALLLLAIQTLVAKGRLHPSLVKLHWFTRDKEGATHVRSGDLDEKGRFGDWPQDFGHVELAAENEYLNASLF